MERPSKHEVEVGRLNKKLNKMKDQRDKARKDLSHYQEVMRAMPYLQRRYEIYQEMQKTEDNVHQLKQRVKEQSLLIAKLTSEN